MKQSIKNEIGAIIGSLLYVISINIFIVPLGLYTGNLTGVCQVINDVIMYLFYGGTSDISLTGTIVFIMNIPLLILAYFSFSRKLFLRTIFIVALQSFALQFIPIPSTPLIDDTFATCLIAGLLGGIGTGTTLKYGASAGGTDIIGLYCAKKYPNFSIGKVQILLSSLVFLYCFIFYDFEIVIYSFLVLVISSMATDKVHEQNIKTSAMIFTKNKDISKCITETLGRGATMWQGEGAYTNMKSYIFVTVISKYEKNRLKQLITSIDKSAFIIFNDYLHVEGNFEKRL